MKSHDLMKLYASAGVSTLAVEWIEMFLYPVLDARSVPVSTLAVEWIEIISGIWMM